MRAHQVRPVESSFPMTTRDLRVCLTPPIAEIAIAAGPLNTSVAAHIEGRFDSKNPVLPTKSRLLIRFHDENNCLLHSRRRRPRAQSLLASPVPARSCAAAPSPQEQADPQPANPQLQLCVPFLVS